MITLVIGVRVSAYVFAYLPCVETIATLILLGAMTPDHLHHLQRKEGRMWMLVCIPQMIDCIFMAIFTCCAKCRRRCPWWLCCFCFCCCPMRTSASGGRYSRVINADAEDDDDSALDDEIEYGVLEEEEDLVRSGKGKQGVSVPPPSRKSGGTASGSGR